MLEKLNNWEVPHKRACPKLLLGPRMVQLVAGRWSHAWRMAEQGRTPESSTLESLFRQHCGAAIRVIRCVSSIAREETTKNYGDLDGMRPPVAMVTQVGTRFSRPPPSVRIRAEAFYAARVEDFLGLSRRSHSEYIVRKMTRNDVPFCNEERTHQSARIWAVRFIVFLARQEYSTCIKYSY